MTSISSAARARPMQIVWYLTVPLVALLWAYWTTLLAMGERWGSDPQYEHGYLVPLFTIFLLWLRRDRLAIDRISPSWWGMPLILAAVAVRLYGAYYHYVWLDQISLLPCIIGLCLVAGGWSALRWAWPALLFLFFMIPLPHSVAIAFAGPLQTIATQCSTYVLQTLGLPALAEGNVILIDQHRIGIVEACSGLRMLVVFFALSTGLILVVNLPWTDKLVLVASAIPIALVTNVIRITVTGFLYVNVTNSEVAKVFFHDVAGWIMMPLALAMLWIEIKILRKLLIDADTPAKTAPHRSPPRVAVSARARKRAKASLLISSRQKQRAGKGKPHARATKEAATVPAADDVH